MLSRYRRLLQIVLVLGSVILATAWNSPAYACCSYGCCDCSCVSLKLAKRAPAIATSIEKGLKGPGSIQSFQIDLSDATKASGRKWSCAAAFNGAYCTRQ